MKQIIIVTETNDKAKIDSSYIDALIKLRYNIGNNETKLQYRYMDGKYKYNNKKLITDINKLINNNKKYENYVIYCFDTDRIDINHDEKIMFEKVEKFCLENNYYFI
ncbi:UNVERIFIED_CONTAM: hypothetical protein O8I53_08480 [Campylobacter lari]